MPDNVSADADIICDEPACCFWFGQFFGFMLLQTFKVQIFFDNSVNRCNRYANLASNLSVHAVSLQCILLAYSQLFNLLNVTVSVRCSWMTATRLVSKGTRGVNLMDKLLQTFKSPSFVRKHLEQLLRTLTFVLSQWFNNTETKQTLRCKAVAQDVS